MYGYQKLYLNNTAIDFPWTAKALGVVLHEHMLWDSETVRNKLRR